MPDVVDLAKLGRTPGERAFDRFIQYRVDPEYRKDEAFVALIKVFFMSGWEACEDFADDPESLDSA
jgi:hypothetical protein